MAQLKFSSGQAMQTARKLNTEARKINDTNARLESTVKKLSGSWEGDSQQTFTQQYTKLKGSVQQLSKLADDIAKQLNQIADIKKQTEQRVSNLFK